MGVTLGWGGRIACDVGVDAGRCGRDGVTPDDGSEVPVGREIDEAWIEEAIEANVKPQIAVEAMMVTLWRG